MSRSKGLDALRIGRAQQHEMQRGHENAQGHDAASASTDRIDDAPKGAAATEEACPAGVKGPGAL